MSPALHIVDVFADRAYAGNPLAVVLDDDFTDDERRLVAAEMNFSETTFARSVPEADGAHTTRIYTPSQELAFAGHPLLGTAWVLRHVAARPSPTVRLALRIGPITVDFEPDGEGADVAWFRAPSIDLGPRCEPAAVASALGLAPEDLDRAYPVQKLGAGTAAMMVALRGLDAVRRARLDLERFRPLAERGFPPLFYVFSRETHRSGNHLCARFFFVAHAVREDPASGNAAAFFGRWLLEHGYFERVPSVVRIEQGYELDRPSLVLLRAARKDDGFDIRVGGRVFPVARGELVPPRR